MPRWVPWTDRQARSLPPSLWVCRDRQAAYQRHLAAPNMRQGFSFPDPPYRRVDCVLPAAVRWRVRAVMAMEAGGADARGPGAAPAPAAVEAGAGAWLATDDIAEFDE